MARPYRIFGGDLSPYSIKVRSYFRYKQIPHEWIHRSPANQDEFRRYARLPLVPLVVTPDDRGMQDSTPIIEAMEAEYPEPSIHPPDPTAAFVSVLLEEFGDEWGNKWMFHYRWARPADQESGARRIAQGMNPAADEETLQAMTAQVRERMVPRVWFVGSNEQTAPQIEQSFLDAVDLIEAHLDGRDYLFGDRPAFGDFGIGFQMHQAWTDPTPNSLLEERAPRTVAWVKRLVDPTANGEFEDWASLAPTLAPLLEQQVGAIFLPWSVANAGAIAGGQEEFSVTLGSGEWNQKPQKYHARSLAALRGKYGELSERGEIDAVLESTGCRRWLAA